VDTALQCQPPELKKNSISFSVQPKSLLGKIISSESYFDHSDILIQNEKEGKSSVGVSFSNFYIESISNLPSDQSFHKVEIMNCPLEYQIIHQCVPRLDTSVYMKLISTNNTNHCLLEGPVAVYVDNDYISTSTLNVKKTNILIFRILIYWRNLLFSWE
jgi:hypothetical protein